MATMTDALVNSGADLVSSVDPGIFEGADSVSDPTEGGVSTDTTTDDTSEPDYSGLTEATEPEPEPAVDETVGPPDEGMEDAPKPAVAAEELPEGVERGKNSSGKPGMWVKETRWNNLEAANKLIREASEAFGEPITAETLDFAQKAVMGQERLYNDLLSGDPKAQASLINHFFNEAETARKEGLVSTNPMVSFTEQFYQTLPTRDPDAYASLRFQTANDLVKEMYQQAASTGNRNLWLSAGHIAKTLGMEFKTEAEMAAFGQQQQPDVVTQLQAENAALRQAQQGTQVASAQTQFQGWKAETGKSVQGAITSQVVTPALEGVQKSWEKFPSQYQQLVVNPLRAKVVETLNKDKTFNERVAMLDGQAQRASSAQMRSAIANQLQNLFVQRARLAADAHKGPILKEAAELLQQQNQQAHSRRQNAQAQRTPGGTESTPQRSLVPKHFEKMGDSFDTTAALRDLTRLVNL